MTGGVKTIAILVAKPDKAVELQRLLEGMVDPSRSEPGNLTYDLWLHQADPNCFVLDEAYVDHAAIEKHRASPHFQSYLASIGDLADRTVFVLNPVNVG